VNSHSHPLEPCDCSQFRDIFRMRRGQQKNLKPFIGRIKLRKKDGGGHPLFLYPKMILSSSSNIGMAYIIFYRYNIKLSQTNSSTKYQIIVQKNKHEHFFPKKSANNSMVCQFGKK
jgi:hypothetical protein